MSTEGTERTEPSNADSREPTFDPVRRGYDPKQVLAYVKRMTDRVRTLEDRAWGLEAELEAAQAKGKMSPSSDPADPYGQISDLVVEAVRAFDESVKRMRHEAEVQARTIVDETKAKAERDARNTEELRQQAMAEIEGMLPEAKAEADRIRADAQTDADRIRVGAQARAEEVRAEAERALVDAKAQADTAHSELESRRESLVAELRTLHDRMLDSARDLESVMETDRAPDEVVVP